MVSLSDCAITQAQSHTRKVARAGAQGVKRGVARWVRRGGGRSSMSGAVGAGGPSAYRALPVHALVTHLCAIHVHLLANAPEREQLPRRRWWSWRWLRQRRRRQHRWQRRWE